MILGPGSTLGINVQNAQGNAGVGCDTVHDLGALTLTGSNLPGELITISLASLFAAGTPGAAQNFDPSQFYGFTLVTANGGITGFTPDEFAVDSGGFANALNGGVFTVAENGNTLRLDFNPAVVPEPPSSWGAVMRALELTDCVVTADALHCQRNTAREIKEADADYVLALKGNQGLAYTEIKDALDEALARAEPQLAKLDAQTVRVHWAIENNLRWVLDMVFGEDQSRARTGFAVANLGVARRLTLNLLRQDQTPGRSIKRKQLRAVFDTSCLESLLKF